MYQFNREEYNKRMEWYVDARFGMFINYIYHMPLHSFLYLGVILLPTQSQIYFLINVIELVCYIYY